MGSPVNAQNRSPQVLADQWVTASGAIAAGAASCTPSGPPTGVGQSSACSVDYRLYEGGSVFTGHPSATSESGSGEVCIDPPPPGCDQDAPEIGWKFSGSSSTMATASYCHAVAQCKVEVKQSVGADGAFVYTGVVTNQDCDAGAVAPPGTAAPESCVAVGDGEYCASANAGDGSCGYMNDSFVCLAKVSGDECKPLADGGTVCGSSAGTPPVPDTGTRGEAAAPSGSVETAQGNTYNYYNSTTVSSSSVTSSDGSNPQDSGGSPSGGSEGGELPGDECVGPNCTVSLPVLEDVGTLREAASAFWSRLEEVPVVAAVGDIGSSIPAGARPTWSTSFSFFGESMEVDFSGALDIWDAVSGVLSAVCLALWGLLAVRLFLSA